jgi:hypothetical protein
MSGLSDDPNICTKCVGDKHFVVWLRENGQYGQCGIDPSHGRSRKVVPASGLAEEVDAWFRENYTQGSEESYVTEHSDSPSYRQRGEPYEDILLNQLECDEDVVRAISEHLPDVSHRDLTQGAEPFYDSTQNYEALADIERRNREEQEEYWFENRIRFQWEDFCEKVQYERRFFQIKQPLDELFGDPKEYEDGTIKPVYMLPAGEKIYRARLLDDGLTEEQVRKSPARQLGAPPRERASAGRMNVELIPAFYAAFSEETAVAEIRPGIGEQVAIGEFVLQRDLKMFDFTAFARAGHEKWREAYAHTRFEFINQMEGEISKPILPFDRQREYIPTQIVAEYLREYFGCEAVVYRSSMIKDRDKESRNIVLLNRGEAFLGEDGAPLAFSKVTIKEVMNVSYELAEYLL